LVTSVLVSLSAVTLLDMAAGVFYRTSTAAVLHVTSPAKGPVERALVVFPGYAMPGDDLSRAFAPFLPAVDAMIVVEYAERGVDVPAIYNSVMAELAVLAPHEVTVYGGSMGGMLARDFLDLYHVNGAPWGKVTLVLDSAPSSSARTRGSAPIFWISSWYRGGPLSTAIAAVVGQGSPEPQLEPDANPEAATAARHASAWIGMPALTSQAAFIAMFSPLREGELEEVVARAVYLKGHGPSADPVVDTDDSIVDWRRAVPGMTVVIVPGREARWHLPLIERPRETMAAILAA
jgi:hypothetical protein